MQAEPTAALTQAQRKAQLEQLASLGVSIPEELRRDLAMAGDWTVTATRVIPEDEEGKAKDSKAVLEATATGVRKREKTEEEREEEEAVRGLFAKKRKEWGRDIRTMPADDEADLDALLSGALVKKETVKKEEAVKEEPDAGEQEPKMKQEEDVPEVPEEGTGQDTAGADAKDVVIKPDPEAEDSKAGLLGTSPAPPAAAEAGDQPAVVFKKRKKNKQK